MRDFRVVRLLVRSSVRVVRSFGSFIRSVVRARHRCALVVVKPFGWYMHIVTSGGSPVFPFANIFRVRDFRVVGVVVYGEIYFIMVLY